MPSVREEYWGGMCMMLTLSDCIPMALLFWFFQVNLFTYFFYLYFLVNQITKVVV